MVSKGSNFLVYLAFIPLHIFGQHETVIFNFFDETDGLPNNVFSTIFQDQANNIWIGTYDGLSRFDGFNITEFRHDALDTQSISSNNIKCIAQDLTGQIWIGTTNAGLNVFNKVSGKFKRILSSSTISVSDAIFDIAVDGKNRIWIVGNHGLHIISQVDGNLSLLDLESVCYYKHANLNAMSPTVLKFDSSNRMWVGTEEGICMIGLDNGLFLCPQVNSGFPFEVIDDIEVDQKENIWISRKHGMYRCLRFDNESQRFSPAKMLRIKSANRRLKISFDHENRIWMSVFGDQLYAYDLTDSSLFLESHINSNIGKERFLRKPMTDHAGGVWIPGEGIYRYNKSTGFRHLLHNAGPDQSNTCIFVDSSNYWLGYREQGMLRISKETRSTLPFAVNQNGWQRTPTNLMQSIIPLQDQSIAVAGMRHLMIINDQAEKTKSIPIRGIARSVIQAKNGTIWVASFGGLIKVDEHGEVLKTYTMPPFKGESRNFIQCLYEDSSGDIWFGSEVVGLHKIRPESELITSYLLHQDEASLISSTVVDLSSCNDSMLWIGTDIGLVALNIQTDRHHLFNANHGFANDFISSVIATKDQIWVGTHAGISKFDPVDLTAINYDRSDGLLNSSFYRRAKASFDGNLYFGGKDGIDFFSPKDLESTFQDPSIRLYTFATNLNTSLDADSLLQTEVIQLTHQEDVVELEFGATDYLPQEKMEYSYQMIGLNETWVNINNQRRLLFADLAPGHYELSVRARPRGKVWSSNTLDLSIMIAAPFWQTLWFKIISFLFITAISILLIKKREIQIKQREQRESQIKQRLLQLEKKAVLAQMNPDFIFNCMNGIQQFMTKRDFSGAMQYLNKFSRILRQVLSMSAHELVPISQEIKLVEDYLKIQSLRYPARFNYVIVLPKHGDFLNTLIPPFLVQPQIEQAIRNSIEVNRINCFFEILVQIRDGVIEVLVIESGREEHDLKAIRDAFQGNIHLINERIKNMNKVQNQDKIRIEKSSKKDGSSVRHQTKLIFEVN